MIILGITPIELLILVYWQKITLHPEIFLYHKANTDEKFNSSNIIRELGKLKYNHEMEILKLQHHAVKVHLESPVSILTNSAQNIVLS